MMRKYLNRAKLLLEKKDEGEMKKLKEEVQQSKNPFIRCILNLWQLW